VVIGIMSGVSSLAVPLVWIFAGAAPALTALLALIFLTEVLELFLDQPRAHRRAPRGVD